MEPLERRKKLLLVDDVELFLKLQISFLGNQRFEIFTARTGSEALEMVPRIKPDLVLLDMFMQDMTGDSICRTLKSDPETSSIPVIIISSSSVEGTREKAMDAGCDVLLFKPIRKDQFISVVEDCLGMKIRKHLRVNVSFPGTVILGGREKTATIHTLSVGGAFVEADDGEALKDDFIGLRFYLPGSQSLISVETASVVWRGRLADNGPEGAGIRFMNIHPKATNRISRYLTDILAREVMMPREILRANP